MTDCQFFWYMVVNVFVALGTIGAVIVSLFGRRFFPPKLTLTLPNIQGELTNWKHDGKEASARFYQIRVTNKRRWSPASNIGVHLISVDEVRPDNEFHQAWSGDVQLKWKHSRVNPPPTTVGKAADYDMVSVNPEGKVEIHPIVAASSLTRVRDGRCRFAVWLQARANESDSSPIRIEISWDGTWKEQTQAMAEHFIIKKV